MSFETIGLARRRVIQKNGTLSIEAASMSRWKEIQMKGNIDKLAVFVLVSILFCPMAIAVPTMPADLQMVQPDPSLPKELSAFFGKWEWISNPAEFFLIVEKIDEEKASLYVWRGGSWPQRTPIGWERVEAKVIKDRGKYKLSCRDADYTLMGEYLITFSASDSSQLRRVS